VKGDIPDIAEKKICCGGLWLSDFNEEIDVLSDFRIKKASRAPI
jgi:hypothetical protein